jgi:membrane-bound serine protease (ClpP class)
VVRFARLLVALAAALALTAPLALASEPGGQVEVATLTGTVDPITENYLARTLDRAVQHHAQAVVIRMDTPGGLDTSMRGINRAILRAPLPVVVWVAPAGARAASAGLFITQAADVAVMAPGTNIGSAHHVTLGGGGAQPSGSEADTLNTKIENDAAAYIRALATDHGRNAEWAEQGVRKSVNVTADEAVELHVVDFISRDLKTLLRDLDGRVVEKKSLGRSFTLATAGARVVEVPMGGIAAFLHVLADPNIAVLLLSLAVLAIAFEVTHPGLILPGVVGVIAAVLAFSALENLPLNLAGVILLAFALILFIVDLTAPTHGVLTTGGIISMALGAFYLINTDFLDEGVNVALIALMVLAVGAFFGLVLRKVYAARRRPPVTGREGMIGAVGRVREALAPSGLVFVDGALWQARAPNGVLIAPGESVTVVGIDGLQLLVQKEATPPAGGN